MESTVEKSINIETQADGKVIISYRAEKITRDKLINPKLINDHTFQNFKISRRLWNCLYAMDIIYPI